MAKKKTENNILKEIKLFDFERKNLNFADICKFIKNTLDVTQEELAEKLFITSRTYRHWEEGKYVPKGWQAFDLCLLYLYAKEKVSKESIETQTPLQPDKNQTSENQVP